MRLVRALSVIGLLMALTVGCSDSTDPQDVTLADLVGTWVGTKAEFTSQADPGLVFDLVANGGTFNFTLASDGTLTGTQGIAPFVEQWSGTVTVANGIITVTDDDVPPEVLSFTFTLSGNQLSMTTDDVEFAFPPSEVEVPVILVLELLRQ